MMELVDAYLARITGGVHLAGVFGGFLAAILLATLVGSPVYFVIAWLWKKLRR